MNSSRSDDETSEDNEDPRSVGAHELSLSSNSSIFLLSLLKNQNGGEKYSKKNESLITIKSLLE